MRQYAAEENELFLVEMWTMRQNSILDEEEQTSVLEGEEEDRCVYINAVLYITSNRIR